MSSSPQGSLYHSNRSRGSAIQFGYFNRFLQPEVDFSYFYWQVCTRATLLPPDNTRTYIQTVLVVSFGDLQGPTECAMRVSKILTDQRWTVRFSSLTTGYLSHSALQIDTIAMVGIAGGVKLGDVVFGAQAISYDTIGRFTRPKEQPRAAATSGAPSAQQPPAPARASAPSALELPYDATFEFDKKKLKNAKARDKHYDNLRSSFMDYVRKNLEQKLSYDCKLGKFGSCSSVCGSFPPLRLL
jgi:hypothetical protein